MCIPTLDSVGLAGAVTVGAAARGRGRESAGGPHGASGVAKHGGVVFLLELDAGKQSYLAESTTAPGEPGSARGRAALQAVPVVRSFGVTPVASGRPACAWIPSEIIAASTVVHAAWTAEGAGNQCITCSTERWMSPLSIPQLSCGNWTIKEYKRTRAPILWTQASGLSFGDFLTPRPGGRQSEGLRKCRALQTSERERERRCMGEQNQRQ